MTKGTLCSSEYDYNDLFQQLSHGLYKNKWLTSFLIHFFSTQALKAQNGKESFYWVPKNSLISDIKRQSSNSLLWIFPKIPWVESKGEFRIQTNIRARTFFCLRLKRLHHKCLIGSYPAGIYLLKVNNRNTWRRSEICSKLTIKTPERHEWHHSRVFIVNFKHVIASWVCTLWILNRHVVPTMVFEQISSGWLLFSLGWLLFKWKILLFLWPFNAWW